MNDTILRRPEKHLERLVLRAVGRFPDLLIGINETDVLYRHSTLPMLCAALKPFGPEVVKVAVDVLAKSKKQVGQVGAPDLLLSYRGMAAGWELKTEVGVVSAEQKRWHAAARMRGMTIEVIRSEAQALEALQRMAARRVVAA